MAKDYFQDIMPPDLSEMSQRSDSMSDAGRYSESTNADLPEKTIRNIQVPISARTKSRIDADLREPVLPVRAGRLAGRWLWGGSVLALIVIGAIALVALRPTSVTVIPRSHNVSFEEPTVFIAQPTPAATGTLTFTLDTTVLEDSEIVPAKGIERIEEKANGTITVHNEYSAKPVKLLKNTRFATPEGLIFRVPVEVIVPGKKDSAPGEISVSVMADVAGEKYNVGPVARFVVPGLKSSPAMYSSVYASSKTAMVGGFAGERPAASKQDVDSARANIRDRMHKKILEIVRVKNSGATIAFVDLAYIAFESLPQTAEADGGARINERVRIELPVFEASNFASAISKTVSVDADKGNVVLKDVDKLTTQIHASSYANSGSAIQFTLKGSTQLIWKVDTLGLSQAIAGRDKSAFEAIIRGFPEISEANTRIHPFWKHSFPKDAGAIKIRIIDPKSSS